MANHIFDTIEALSNHELPSDNDIKALLETNDEDVINRLYHQADLIRRKIYGTDVYIRGLIEFTNYCKNNCYYCGIRRDNNNTSRYRLTRDDILFCCDEGYKLGFRTFVLQGGEDGFFTGDKICDIVSTIKNTYSDCAVTLSIGEWDYDSYKAFFNAGADRYLLRHETANNIHYGKLHPDNMSLDTRKNCLFNLRKIGFQTGSGFMVGSPFQTLDNIIEDLKFLLELKPHMIGIGPYVTHKDTPFKDYSSGSLDLTLKLISILRLMHPHALIPATTALGTIHPEGREMGLKAGANVVMPNLSPVGVREKYSLYDNKICTGDEAAQCINCLTNRVQNSGYNIVTHIGHAKM